jgi:type II secretory pathway predicted ATPase ExeA
MQSSMRLRVPGGLELDGGLWAMSEVGWRRRGYLVRMGSAQAMMNTIIVVHGVIRTGRSYLTCKFSLASLATELQHCRIHQTIIQRLVFGAQYTKFRSFTSQPILKQQSNRVSMSIIHSYTKGREPVF